MGLVTSRIENPEDIVYNSIKSGVRLIETSYKYNNEEDIGKGIDRALKDNLCKREDLIIMGKIWVRFRKDPEKALKDS